VERKRLTIAKRVVEDRALHEWFTDRPNRVFVESGIDEGKVVRLSEARKRVGADLKFIDERLPSPANLPDAHALLEWHRDLIAAGSLNESITASEPLLRRVVTSLGLEGAETLAMMLKEHVCRISALMNELWVWGLIERQATDPTTIDRLRSTALAFISEANELVAERTVFVARPVSLPSQLPPFLTATRFSMPWRRARTHSACLQSV